MNPIPDPSSAAAAHATERQLRPLLDTVGVIIVGLRPDHTIFEWNEGATRTFGYWRDEMLGKDFFTAILPAAHHERMASELRHALAGEIIRNLETPGIECNQETSILLWNMTRIVDAADQVVGVLAVGQDVTERERAARAVDEARRAAEAANKARGDFLANMSHEIRTPLNGILGMTELVLESPLAPDQRARLLAAHRSAEDLLALVNDILDFSRIDAGKLELHREDFSLSDALAASWRLFGARAARKAITFAVQTDPALPDAFNGDSLRLRQIVNNLVDNAIKFTDRGGVEIELRREPAPPSAVGRVILHGTVSDTGPGIVPEKQARIFEAFRQADSSISRHFSGTGLGLAICLQLVRLMDGRLWVESVPGHGSRFHFTLNLGLARAARSANPIEPPAPVGQPPSSSAPPHPVSRKVRTPLHIWLAEDNPINREVVLGMLEGSHQQVTAFPDGRSVVAAFEARPESPDIILLDLQMPGLNGIEAALAIRQLERARPPSRPDAEGRRVPLIALTANARPEDRAAALAAGIDGYLTKPVRRAALEKALAGVPPRPAASRELEHNPASAREPGAEAFDRQALMADLDGDLARFCRLAKAYLDHTPAVRSTLRLASQGDDRPGVAGAAHLLIGSLSQLHASDAIALARALEKEANENSPTREISLLALDRELDRVEASLRAELVSSTQ